MNKLLFALAQLMPAIAMAAEGGHGGGHEEGIPSSVIYQAINFVLFIGLLIFLLRRPVKEYFRGRQEAYRMALQKAESARREAEAKRQEIQECLAKLESTTSDSVAQARAEAEALKQKIVSEAQQLSASLREEAQRTAALEVERAKNQLREEMLAQAVALSRKMLEEKIAEPDQKRLQTEFVDKIQVVR